ncbi:MAG: YraN family protein [Symbiobacteriaceae bacterium]|nr:MAG: YraN family protein [Bacillota bacterium]
MIRQVGREGEEAAVRYLTSLGYRVIARNVRFRSGEIDVVARDGDVLVFVEVKTRRGRGFGSPGEAVTGAKQRRLVRLAALYLARLGGEPPPCRFDVVEVEPGPDGRWRCKLIKGAFQA